MGFTTARSLLPQSILDAENPMAAIAALVPSARGCTSSWTPAVLKVNIVAERVALGEGTRAPKWARDAGLDIEGLGGSIDDALIEKDLVKDVGDLFALTEDQLAELDMGTTSTGGTRTLGQKNATRIMAKIEKRQGPAAEQGHYLPVHAVHRTHLRPPPGLGVRDDGGPPDRHRFPAGQR